jgi:hypothetical protein
VGPVGTRQVTIVTLHYTASVSVLAPIDIANEWHLFGHAFRNRFMQDFLAGGGKRQGDYTELQVGPGKCSPFAVTVAVVLRDVKCDVICVLLINVYRCMLSVCGSARVCVCVA